MQTPSNAAPFVEPGNVVFHNIGTTQLVLVRDLDGASGVRTFSIVQIVLSIVFFFGIWGNWWNVWLALLLCASATFGLLGTSGVLTSSQRSNINIFMFLNGCIIALAIFLALLLVFVILFWSSLLEDQEKKVKTIIYVLWAITIGFDVLVAVLSIVAMRLGKKLREAMVLAMPVHSVPVQVVYQQVV